MHMSWNWWAVAHYSYVESAFSRLGTGYGIKDESEITSKLWPKLLGVKLPSAKKRKSGREEQVNFWG